MLTFEDTASSSVCSLVNGSSFIVVIGSCPQQKPDNQRIFWRSGDTGLEDRGHSLTGRLNAPAARPTIKKRTRIGLVARIGAGITLAASNPQGTFFVMK
jgi:hypothetical protein